MKILCAATTAALFVTSAVPANIAMAAPLAPGQPAGLTKAQDAEVDNTALYILGLGAIAAGIAILASNSHNAISGSTGGGTTTGGGTGGGGTTTTTSSKAATSST